VCADARARPGHGSSRKGACWNALGKDALVGLEFHYRKAGGNWQFGSVAPQSSRLAKDQEQAAAACVAEAARGTSFPVDAKNAGEVGATVLVLRWEWQVPLPSSADEVAARTTNPRPGGPELPVPPVCKICKARWGRQSLHVRDVEEWQARV
jgi:hypothetical protein